LPLYNCQISFIIKEILIEASHSCLCLRLPSFVDKEIPFCPTRVWRYQKISPASSMLERTPIEIPIDLGKPLLLQFLPLYMVLWYIVDSFYGPQTLSEGRSPFTLLLQFTIVNLIHQAKCLSIVPTSEVNLNPSHLHPSSFENFQQLRSSNTRNTITTTIQPQPFNHNPSYNRPDYPLISLSLNLPYHVEQSKAQALQLRAAQPRSGGPNPSHEEGEGGGKPLNVRGRHEH
jgi:hypothetical protein